MMIVFEILPAVPRRSSAPEPVTVVPNAPQFAAPEFCLQPIIVMLQKFGFERGSRSKPNSLLSPSKPFWPEAEKIAAFWIDRPYWTDPVQPICQSKLSSWVELDTRCFP